MGKRPKYRASVTIDPDLWDWVQANVGRGRRFYNHSHAVEEALALAKEGATHLSEIARLSAQVRDLESRLEECRRQALARKPPAHDAGKPGRGAVSGAEPFPHSA